MREHDVSLRWSLSARLAVGVLLTCTLSNADAATIAYWKFEPGALTVDSSGNGHALSNNGVVSSGDIRTSGSVLAPGTGSASFDGTDFMQTVSSLNLSGHNQITIEWFMKAAPLTGGAVGIVWSHGEDPGGFVDDGMTHLTVGEFGDPTQVRFREKGGVAGNYDVVASFVPSTWHHYAVTIDATQASLINRVHLFRDKSEMGSAYIGAGNIVPFLNDFFQIGVWHATSNPNRFTGLLDEMRISDQILTTSQMIPEPASLAGMLAAGALFMLQRRPKWYDGRAPRVFLRARGLV